MISLAGASKNRIDLDGMKPQHFITAQIKACHKYHGHTPDHTELLTILRNEYPTSSLSLVQAELLSWYGRNLSFIMKHQPEIVKELS